MTKNKIAQFFLYLWLLIWPWQTKLILRSSDSPYQEISLFLSLGLLIVPIFIWSHQIFTDDYWRFKNEMTKPWWWLGLIIWELITLCSIFWAQDVWLVLYRYIILVFGILLFYIIKQKDFVKEELVAKCFLIGLVLPALLAIWQFFTQSTFASKYLGLAYHAANVLGDSVVETDTGRFLRAYGSFDHPNILGGAAVLGILLVFYFGCKKEINRNERLFYLGLLAIFYLALLASFSRSAILALALSMPVVLFYIRHLGHFQKKLAGFFVFLLLGMSLAFIIPNRDLFSARTQVTTRLEQKSISERELYFGQAKKIISKNWLLGVGANNYTTAVKINDGYAYPYWYYQPVHNYWLLALAELGIFGFLGVAIFWFGIFKISLKKKLWPIIGALFVLSLLDHWLWDQTLGILMLFVVMGLIFRENDL